MTPVTCCFSNAVYTGPGQWSHQYGGHTVFTDNGLRVLMRLMSLSANVLNSQSNLHPQPGLGSGLQHLGAIVWLPVSFLIHHPLTPSLLPLCHPFHSSPPFLLLYVAHLLFPCTLPSPRWQFHSSRVPGRGREAGGEGERLGGESGTLP